MNRYHAAWAVVMAVIAGWAAWEHVRHPVELRRLDFALASLEGLPDYTNDVWFQGQGVPVARALLREGEHRAGTVRTFVLPEVLSRLPCKNNQERHEWVQEVNDRYRPWPRWIYNPGRRMGHYKCMSLSSSTVCDWWALRSGRPLPAYRSMISGEPEAGVNPKMLDALYRERAAQRPDLFKLTEEGHLDPVSRERVPFNLEGFVDILNEAAAAPEEEADRERRVADQNLSGVSYPYRWKDFCMEAPAHTVFRNVVFEEVFPAHPRRLAERLKAALRAHGPALAGIRIRLSTSGGLFKASELGNLPIPFLSGHGVVIVGYVERGDATYFLYRETFGAYDEEWADGGPAYRLYPVFGFNEAYVFPHPGRGITQSRPRPLAW